MNNLRPSERLARVLAFFLCGLVYLLALGFIFQGLENRPAEHSVSVVSPVKLSFAQMELTAAEEPPPQKEPKPEIVPKPEEVDVVLEEVIEKEPETEPEPEPVIAEAQVTQEASAVEESVDNTDHLVDWIFEQIEMEKYYPPSAQRAGLEGAFELVVTLDAGGTVVSAKIVSGEGHLVLRRALEKTADRLLGRNFGRSLGKSVDVPVGVDFELE